MARPPTWKRSATVGALAAVLLFVLFAFLGRGKQPIASAAVFALFAALLYIPGGYYMESWMYRRRMRQRQQGQQGQPRVRK